MTRLDEKSIMNTPLTSIAFGSDSQKLVKHHKQAMISLQGMAGLSFYCSFFLLLHPIFFSGAFFSCSIKFQCKKLQMYIMIFEYEDNMTVVVNSLEQLSHGIAAIPKMIEKQIFQPNKLICSNKGLQIYVIVG